MKSLPETARNLRWAAEQLAGFMRWLLAKLPQEPLPPIVIQGGDAFTPRVFLAKDVTPDNDFDYLVDRLMQDLNRARGVLD